jgi:hypothetical protein
LWELYRTTPTLIIYRVSYTAPNLKKHGYALNTKKNDLVKFLEKKSQKVYRVLDIRELNTKLWMVQVVVLYKAFINFFTACKKIKNSLNDIDFSEKIPHENPPWGKIPHGGFSKKCTGFSISRTLTQKSGWYKFFFHIKHLLNSLPHVKRLKTE